MNHLGDLPLNFCSLTTSMPSFLVHSNEIKVDIEQMWSSTAVPAGISSGKRGNETKVMHVLRQNMESLERYFARYKGKYTPKRKMRIS